MLTAPLRANNMPISGVTSGTMKPTKVFGLGASDTGRPSAIRLMRKVTVSSWNWSRLE